MGFPDQTSPLVRAVDGVERDRIASSVESRAVFSTMQEDEEEEDKEVWMFNLHCNKEHVGFVFQLVLEMWGP